MAETLPGRVALPSLLSRSWTMWLSLGVAVVGGLAVVGWIALTDPANRPYAVVVAALVVVAVLLVTLRRRWLDVDAGAVVLQVAGVWRRSWRWAEASEVAIVTTQAGQVLLRLRDPQRRTAFQHTLVADDLGGERAQPPEVLRTLADQIEQWSPRHTGVARRLRSQADHLTGGGAARGSPLMPR